MPFSTNWLLGYQPGPLAFATSDETVTICGNCLAFQAQTATGEQRRLNGAARGIDCFSVNKKSGLVGYAEKGLSPRLRIHSTSDLRLLASISWNTEAVFAALAFSGDGVQLAAIEQEVHSRLTVWNWQQGKQLYTGQLDRGATCVSFHPTKQDLLCTTGNGVAALWHVPKHATTKELQCVPLSTPGLQPTCHAWHPGGLYLGCAGGQVLAVDTAQVLQTTAKHAKHDSQSPTLDTADGADASPTDSTGLHVLVTVEYSGQAVPLESLAVNRDCLAVAGHSPIIRLYEHSSKAEQLTLLREVDLCVVGVCSLAWGGHHHTTLAVGSFEATTHAVDFPQDLLTSGEAHEVKMTGDFHLGKVHASGALPDGRHIATAGEDGSLRLWNLHTHRCSARRTFSTAQVCLAASRHTPLIALGSEAGVLRLVDAGSLNLTVVHRSRLGQGPIKQMAFSPDGKTLAVLAGTRMWFVEIDGADAIKVAGYFNIEGDVLGMTWMSEAKTPLLLLSLASGMLEGMTPDLTQTHTGLELPGAAMHTGALKLDHPLMHIQAAASAGKPQMAIIGMGLDRVIKRYELHKDPAGWDYFFTVIPRATTPGPQKADGCLCTSPDRSLVVVGSADGSVTLLPGNLAFKGGDSVPVVLHNMWSGGVSTASFDATGRSLLTAGNDGAVVLHTVMPSGDSAPSQLPEQPTPLAAMPDVDAVDEDAEPTEDQVQAEHAKEQQTPESQAAQQRILSELVSLRSKAWQRLHQNEQAKQREQLSRPDLIVDVMGMGQLKALGQARVEALRESIRQSGMTEDIIWGRLKEVGWDGMEVQQTQLTGIRSAVQVSNFPIPRSRASEPLMDKLLTIHQQQLDPKPQKVVTLPSNTMSLVGQQSMGSMTSPSPSGMAPPSIFGRTLPRGSAHAEGLTPEEEEEAQRLGFGGEELTPPAVRLLKAYALQQDIHTVQEHFNTEFSAAKQRKQAELDKILEASNHMTVIVDELAHMGVSVGNDQSSASWAPTITDDAEDSVLTVKDSEVHVPRHLSAKEKARLEAEAAEEAARAKANAGNDMTARALKQMMNGTPTGNVGPANQAKLSQPAWMKGDPSTFTAEQQLEVKAWEEKVSAVEEEQIKHRAALESELKNLKASQEELAATFDASLLSLQETRLKQKLRISQLQLQRLKLLASADALTELSSSAEYTMQTELAEAEGRLAAKQTELEDVSVQLQDQREMLSSLQQEDKAVDRAWKKESSEDDHHARVLYQLFRKRDRHQAASANQAAAEDPADRDPFPAASQADSEADSAAAVDDSLAESDQPSDLSEAWWKRLNEVRQHKTELEQHIQRQQTALADLVSHQENLQVEMTLLEAAQESKQAQLDLFQSEKERLEADMDVPLKLKQGQVEIELQGIVDGNLDLALLIPESLIQSLNGSVMAEGARKVDVLKATKDFKKGIYGLQWEHTYANKEVENLTELLRELQMLRVTRDVQAGISKGESGGATHLHPASHDLLTLEAKSKHNERLNEKNVKERKTKLARLDRAIQDKQAANAHLLKEQEQVRSKLEATAPASPPPSKAESPHARRMRNLATQRQLKDIAAMQQERMAQLQAEIGNLHKRLYPSFAQQHIVYPDEVDNLMT